MKILAVIAFLAVAMSADGKTKNPYLALRFDKVMMYDFSGSRGFNHFIVENKGKLATSITKKTQLDKQDIGELNTRLGEKNSYGGEKGSCFNSHLGLVYYLKGKIVAHITISLDCNVLVSSIPIEAQKQGKLGDGHTTFYVADGPSKSFRLFLNGLLKKYKFSHQIKS